MCSEVTAPTDILPDSCQIRDELLDSSRIILQLGCCNAPPIYLDDLTRQIETSKDHRCSFCREPLDKNAIRSNINETDWPKWLVPKPNYSRKNISDQIFPDGTNLDEGIFVRTKMSRVQLRGASMRQARLKDAVCDHINLYKASLATSTISGNTSFDHANMAGVNLSKSYIGQNVSFTNTIMFGVAFTAIVARGIVLKNALLGFNTFEDAEIPEADFTGAYLRNANLRKANLRGAKLIDCDLKDADLDGAILDDIDLTGSSLIGANIDLKDFKKIDPLRKISVPKYQRLYQQLSSCLELKKSPIRFFKHPELQYKERLSLYTIGWKIAKLQHTSQMDTNYHRQIQEIRKLINKHHNHDVLANDILDNFISMTTSSVAFGLI